MDTTALFDIFTDTTAQIGQDEFSVPSEYTEQASTPAIISKKSKEPSSPNRWDPRFVVDLALGIDALPDILDRYQITEEEFEALSSVQAFRQELASTMRDIRENGLSFVAKAKVQAESYLTIVDEIVNDHQVAASTRLEAIKSTVAWGRLLPKEEKNGGVTSAAQINVNISF